MFRSSIVGRALPALVLSAMVLVACADKNVRERATSQGGGTAAGEVSPETARPAASASGVVPVMAPGITAPLPDTGLPVGELPNRPRRDSVALASMTKPDSALDSKWPVKLPPAAAGALLPANRIVAFYGNPLEKRMGALGEFPKAQMLAMLDKEVARWAKADPSHPVIPALHMVVTTAQGAPGKNGLYRLRMRDSLVSAIHSWAKETKGIFFVDVQLGMDKVENEVARLRPILENADVHLALDPEFAMLASGAVCIVVRLQPHGGSV